MLRSVAFTFLLLFLPFWLLSQIDDTFHQDSIDEEWQGDVASFMINGDQQLQLQAEGAGTSTLLRTFDWAAEQTWQWWTTLDFSPSNSNYVEFVLWADDLDLDVANGWTIRMGESGSDDDITLYELVEGDRSKVADGTDGLVANGPVVVRTDVFFADDGLHIQADIEGGFCFLDEVIYDVPMPEAGSQHYFGWVCRYTSTRRDKFFLDDVYVGQKRVDIDPPQVLDLTTDPNTVTLNFSEVMDASSLVDADIVLSPSVSNLEIEMSKGSLILTAPDGWDNTVEYELDIFGLTDLAGNILDVTITIVIATFPTADDLHLSEILFNPIGSGADYVELYNSSEGLIDVSIVKILNQTNGRSVALTNVPNIKGQSYFVLTDDRENVISSFPEHDAAQIVEIDIPTFSNESGNVSLAINGQIVESYDYHEDHHNRFVDEVDGVSLERISLTESASLASNWSSAIIDTGGGTPGLPNSSAGTVAESNEFEVTTKIFYPSGSIVGTEEGVISYQLDAGDYIGSAKIFTDQGQRMGMLFSNTNMPASGKITWDGRLENGGVVPEGIYIVQLQLFNERGTTVNEKFTFGVGH